MRREWAVRGKVECCACAGLMPGKNGSRRARVRSVSGGCREWPHSCTYRQQRDLAVPSKEKMMASQSLSVVDCHPTRQMVPPAGFSPLADGGRHREREDLIMARAISEQPLKQRLCPLWRVSLRFLGLVNPP